ncbi:MAG: P1 family peptidase [Thermoleophilia bacterium]|nr:P1 family peptidase [Thermoleophilia bacterium]MDH5333434.1 P1 family peptidase [Thermoleophilia bacterium]
MRAREIGLEIGSRQPGSRNAITDVDGVRVGMTTLVAGADVRTGVTVIVPPPEPLIAGCHRLNGNGELTGLEWIRESGMLTTAIGITNTFSVGVVRDAIATANPPALDDWALPVVGETWDGVLNDIRGQHVTAGHVQAAFAAASDGPVPEGNVGGGTGMICHGFKGGTGTASRAIEIAGERFTVGVLVQANHGARERLVVEGARVGELIPAEVVPTPGTPAAPGTGSIIGIVATDAPLLPGQCDALAQRAALGVGRLGGAGEISSGDLFLCFSTGNRGLVGEAPLARLRMVRLDLVNELLYAVIEATEEAIVNALLAAETLTGAGGRTAHALGADRLADALRPFGLLR